MLRTMNTFDAIAHIRNEAMSRNEALNYLMEHLGFSVPYAEEIVAVIFDYEEHPSNQADISREAG